MPTLIIIAGPNGIGKSTFSRELASTYNFPRIDPDEIFRTEFTNPDHSYLPYYLQGKAQQYFDEHTSFIYESNLHEPEAFGILNVARDHNFFTSLMFMSTDNIPTLIERVNERTLAGLHNVPVDEIRRRYDAGLRLVPQYLLSFDELSFTMELAFQPNLKK